MSSNSNVIDARKRFGHKRQMRKHRKDAQRLFKDDLEKSGISLKIARALGIFLCKTADEFWDVLKPNRKGQRPKWFTAVGYVIPYFNPDGSRMRFIRVRRLKGEWSRDDDDDRRYTQPSGTEPHAYIPVPIMELLPPVDPVTKKIKIVGRLLIVEGEKKAIIANMCGILAVALGGVWNFTSSKHDLTLVEELRAFDLTECDVVFCYDTDIWERADVKAALRRCAFALRRERLAPKSVREVWLKAEVIGEKLALDDWLAKFKDAETARMRWEAIEPVTDVAEEAFATLDAEVVYVVKQKKYYDVACRAWFPSQRSVVEQYSVGPKVPVGNKQLHPVHLWLDGRRDANTIYDVQFAPSEKDRFRTSESGKYDIVNLWRPSALEPIQYDPHRKDDRDALRPFTDYFNHLTRRLNKRLRMWLLQWMAYPLQHPGAKLKSAVLVVSRAQGVGKSFLFENILLPIYGHDNARLLNGSDLREKYNGFIQAQMACVDEVHMPTYAEHMAVMQTVKTWITGPKIELKEKYVIAHQVPNHCNFYLTSNHPEDALRLEDDDRRFFVFGAPKAKSKREWNAERFRKLSDWLTKEQGLERVYGYLLAVNTKDFNPHADAPFTKAKARMIAGKADALADLFKLLESRPEEILDDKRKELWEPYDIASTLRSYMRDKGIYSKAPVDTASVGARMARHASSIPKRVIKVWNRAKGNTDTVTLYALRDRRKWEKAKDGSWKDNYKRTRR